MTTLRNIPIKAIYDDPQAKFLEYDVYDAGQKAQLQLQRHVNIRTFEDAGVKSPVDMLDLDAFSMSIGDALQMQAIEGMDAFGDPVYNTTRSPAEVWTGGAVQGRLSAHNRWRGLTLNVTASPNVTQSTDTLHPVDLLTGFDDNDFISIALPSFPDGSIDHAQSYVEFTSDPGGVFSGSDRIHFTSNLNSWSAGNMEFRFKRQLVYQSMGGGRNAALKAVTGVKFNFQATGNATVICLAIRLIGKNWLYAPVDIDTRLQRLELAPSVNGATPSFSFPVGVVAGVPTDFPPLFWSDTPSGVTDPRPVDGEFGIAFNAGTISEGTDSEITLYLREVELVTLTQLDLDTSYTQEDLDAYGRQPDYTTPGWVERSRLQKELDPLDQSDLDDDTQFSLDALPDFQYASWIKVDLSWSTSKVATVALSDNEGNGITFPTFSLKDNQDYFFVTHIEDNTLRVRLYEMDTNPSHQTNSTTGRVLSDQRVFDSRLVIDPLWIRRRQGRVGYYTKFGIGDACIYQVLPRGLNFAEYRTKALTSVTPVRGAQIFYGGAPDRESFLNWAPGPFGGTLVNDSLKSRSGKSIKIIDNGQANLQGLQSNVFLVDDFRHTQIEFDINVPTSSGFFAFLYGEYGRVVPLQLPLLSPDKWHHIKLDLDALESVQTGLYTFVILQIGAGRVSNWYVDNPSILRRSLAFAARGRKNNAWNEFPEDWIPLGTHQLNNTQGGGLFAVRERSLQAQAKALTQDAYIDNIRVQPVYAEFGNFVWSDQESYEPTPPSVTLTMVGTTAGAPIGNADSSIQVASTTNFPSNGRLRIGNEVIGYTGLAAGPPRFTGCTRGMNGTTAVSHLTSVPVWPDPFRFIASGTPSPGERITTYEWSFGDTATALGELVTHSYEQAGTYTVGVTAIDSGNRRAETNTMFTF